MKTRHRKGDYLSQPARLLEIDARLREGKHPSHAQLGKELGVSARTIQRDMDYLRDTIGAPLEYDAKQKGWYYTEETFFLPSVLASAQDLQALLLIRQAIGQYEGTPYAEAAKRAFALIEKALPERERLSAEWIRSKVAFTDFPPAEIKKEVWTAVLESLRTQRTLAMTYAKPGTRAARRRVDPYGLIVSEGDWYLYTLDHKSGERRTFLVARIRSGDVTENSFQCRLTLTSRRMYGEASRAFRQNANPRGSYGLPSPRRLPPSSHSVGGIQTRGKAGTRRGG